MKDMYSQQSWHNRVKLIKDPFLLSFGVSHSEVSILVSSIGCQPSLFPTTYVGLPISSSMVKFLIGLQLLTNFAKDCLIGNQVFLFLEVDCLTHIKSVLGNIGTYYFSIFKAPLKVLVKLDGIRRIFLGGGYEKKIAWVAGKKVRNF